MKPLSIVVREDAMVPFDRWLATELTQALGRPVARGLARKAIVAGVVSVAGRITRDPGIVLRRGPSVFVRHLDWLPMSEPARGLRVLYEDDFIIAVDKPAGLPTHGNRDPDRADLTGLVQTHTGASVFVHHRLDLGTSGVVLFAKAPQANASLGRSFASREVEKAYVALVAAPPIEWPAEMIVDTPILVAPNGSVRVAHEGLRAETRIRILERRVDGLLIEARPISGRKHQIRVHLASLGAPIRGDVRYGGPRAPRLMLHAERLELDHPVTGRRLTLRSPRPPEFNAVSAFGTPSRSRPPGRDREPSKAEAPRQPPSGRPRPTHVRRRRPPRTPAGGGERGSRR